MKAKRLGNNTTECYSSFEELAVAWGVKPVSKVTKDMKKLNEQRDRFYKSNTCKVCGNPMTLITGTNIMCCTSEVCKGIKHQLINEETGEAKIWYTPSYKVLDEKGAVIANNILV